MERAGWALLWALAVGTGACGDDDDDTAADGDADADVDGDADGDGDGDADADADGDGDAADCAAADAFEQALPEAADDGARAELWQTLTRTVNDRAGFPVHCGDEVRFYSNDPAVRAVAGDFNAWATDATPVQPLVPPYSHAVATIPAGDDRVLYKWWMGGEQYAADPLALRFGWDEFGEHSLVRGGTDHGHLQRRPPQGGAGLPPRALTLWVPPGYDQGGAERFTVLVMQDGQNLFGPGGAFGSWHVEDVVDGLVLADTIDPIVVVGVDNTDGRIDEYTQVPDAIDGETMGGQADAYGDLLVDTILPYVAARYRVGTGWRDTAILGSSLGGLVSLYLTLTRPDAFGWGGGMSSTVAWGTLELEGETLIDRVPTLGHPGVILYLDSGGAEVACGDLDGDGIWDDPDGNDNYCANQQLHDTLIGDGYLEGEDVFYWHEPGAEHDEAAWSARLFRPLTAFFGH